MSIVRVNYSLQNDFGGTINADQINYQVQQIISYYVLIEINGDVVSLVFSQVLSDDDQTNLTNLVASYVYIKPITEIIPSGEIYYQDIVGTAISLDPPNIYYQINPNCTLLFNNTIVSSPLFDSPNPGQLRWLGPNGQFFKCTFTILGSVNNTANPYTIAIYKNDVLVPGTILSYDFLANNLTTSVTFNKRIALYQNDMVDVRMCAVSPANPRVFTVRNFTLILH